MWQQRLSIAVLYICLRPLLSSLWPWPTGLLMDTKARAEEEWVRTGGKGQRERERKQLGMPCVSHMGAQRAEWPGPLQEPPADGWFIIMTR